MAGKVKDRREEEGFPLSCKLVFKDNPFLSRKYIF